MKIIDTTPNVPYPRNTHTKDPFLFESGYAYYLHDLEEYENKLTQGKISW